jgi:NDP-sugar pyrophosphorylase family protein
MDIPTLVTKLVQEGREVRASLADCRWLDIGRQDDYAEAIATFDALRHEFLPDDLQEDDVAAMEDLT